jgi:hypothetical protein
MYELTPEQQVRLECLITAFDNYNTMLENNIEPTVSPYELAEMMYAYIMDRKIPINSSLN